MRTINILLLPLLLLFSFKATGRDGKKEDHHEDAEHSARRESMVERAAKQSSRDVKIPRALVARLEREYREFLAKQQVTLKDGIKRKLINATAEFTQKRDGALHENVRVVTPLGGGVIDMAEIVTPLRGAFNLKLKGHMEDDRPIDGLRVFFVSQAKPRILAGEEFGSGCGKYMEITRYFNEKMNGRGFDLFSTDRRYASVLGGTFVFVNFETTALGVASVEFTDSRYPGLFCE